MAKVHLVFVSLVRQLDPDASIASYDDVEIASSRLPPDMSQVRQHLAEVDALCPEATEPLFRVLQIADEMSSVLPFQQATGDSVRLRRASESSVTTERCTRPFSGCVLILSAP